MKFAVAISMERGSPDASMHTVKNNMLEIAKMADEGGFETLWTSEHHTIEATIAPNPFQTLVWLGQHTDRIRLGTGTLAAAYWNPIRLAGRSTFCDHLIGGRLEFGIARGAYQYEFDRMLPGIQQQEGVGYMKELVPAVQKLWQGDYAHDGHYWKFPKTAAVPKPLQNSCRRSGSRHATRARSTGRSASAPILCRRHSRHLPRKSTCWPRNSAKRSPTIRKCHAHAS